MLVTVVEEEGDEELQGGADSSGHIPAAASERKTKGLSKGGQEHTKARNEKRPVVSLLNSTRRNANMQRNRKIMRSP